MRRIHIVRCIDCSETFGAWHTNKKRCPECADKKIRENKRTFNAKQKEHRQRQGNYFLN